MDGDAHTPSCALSATNAANVLLIDLRVGRLRSDVGL
jgi:hypothetical protein